MSKCAECGAEFSCGMADGGADQPCWCSKLPALPSEALKAGLPTCLCRSCLQAWIEQIEAVQRNPD